MCARTHSLLYSFFTFIGPSADSSSLGNPDKCVCMCVFEPTHTHFILRLTCHTKPSRQGRLNVNITRSNFRDRQEKQVWPFFSCFGNILTNAVADLRCSCFLNLPSLALKLHAKACLLFYPVKQTLMT